MQASSWHHKLFHFHLPFWIWKVLNLKNEKNFLDEMKNILMVFEGLSFGKKMKIW